MIIRFRSHPGRMDDVREQCAEVARIIEGEPGSLRCTYSFSEEEILAREDYADAEALLAHLAAAHDHAQTTMGAADLVSFEVSGPPAELDRLRETLGPLSPSYYATEFSA